MTDGRTDGQTDRRTEFSSLDRVCIACSAVKMVAGLLFYQPCLFHCRCFLYNQFYFLCNISFCVACAFVICVIKYLLTCICPSVCGLGYTARRLSPSTAVWLRRLQHLHHSCVQCQSNDVSQSSRRSRCCTQHQRRRVNSTNTYHVVTTSCHLIYLLI